MDRAIRLAGSVLGLGHLPVAPGTWGSLGGLLTWWATLPAGQLVQALLLVTSVVPAAFVCGACARRAGQADPSFVVLDEALGMYLALLFLAPSWPWAMAAFAVFRFFDIVKPWPVRVMEERFSGGSAILLDDLLAGAISGLVMLILQLFMLKILFQI